MELLGLEAQLGLEPQLLGVLSPTTLLGEFSAPNLPPWFAGGYCPPLLA